MVAEIKISVKAQEFLNAIRKMGKEFPETAKRIAIEFAEESKNVAITGIIPVVTGNLRSTARVETKQNSVKFITGGIMGRGSPPIFVNYAPYVNYGTSRQSPQFFMERSINIAAERFNSFSRHALRSWLNIIDR